MVHWPHEGTLHSYVNDCNAPCIMKLKNNHGQEKGHLTARCRVSAKSTLKPIRIKSKLITIQQIDGVLHAPPSVENWHCSQMSLLFRASFLLQLFYILQESLLELGRNFEIFEVDVLIAENFLRSTFENLSNNYRHRKCLISIARFKDVESASIIARADGLHTAFR